LVCYFGFTTNKGDDLLTYEELQFEYEELLVVEMDLNNVKGLKGLYLDGCVAIEKTLTNTEKGCILAEEIGHHLTTVGDILDHEDTSHRKQEKKARMVAFDMQVGLRGIIDAYESGCTSLYMTADYLDVTEEFLKEAIDNYRMKYGLCIRMGGYIIYFEPSLGVMRIF
jgi:hypothetical protein